MILGQAVMSLSALVDQFFAAPLAQGSLSTLGFASRFIALIFGILALAIPRAMLPVFARAGVGGGGAVRSLAMRWAGVNAAPSRQLTPSKLQACSVSD
jgi:peptidoglycan biosynthesis protein MviN/MurJ (putative lipid II flippase)